MTRAEALDTLARCARESNEAMQVVLATHPLGVIEAEQKREQADVQVVGGGALEAPLGGDRVPPAAPPSPTIRQCGQRAGWGWHHCNLEPGHDGDCRCSCGLPYDGEGAF